MKRLNSRMGLIGMAVIALGGCSLKLTPEPPASLLTLTPDAVAPVGASAQTGAQNGVISIAVQTPEVPAKLNVVRVPVTVSATEIAYLQDAVWVEKPARLFRNLLGEALRADIGVFVLDSDDTPTLPDMTLRGTLREFGYDAETSTVVIRYDAVRTSGPDGAAATKRFEARESGVLAETASVGPALNRVANTVAGEVAQWVTARRGVNPNAPAIMDKPTN